MAFEELPIGEEFLRFKEHLSLEGNDRILFSGIFGIGKTYLINQFFEKHSSQYIPLKLYPINYSVSANQDIFELIKFDLVCQILDSDVDFEKLEYSNAFASQFYLINNYKEAIKILAKNLSKINSSVEAIASSAIEIGDRIKTFKNKMEVDEKEDLLKFREIFESKEGTPVEANLITNLICSLIKAIKGESEKEVVLIIDDLDRVDPEHIFRILNIFSAHYDERRQNEKNKFGIDKVILICDVANIRSIFHNNYGTETDFTGYIDKFYSIDIFEYNFKPVIIKSLDKFMESVSASDDYVQNHFQSKGGYYIAELTFFLQHFIAYNLVSMRTLIKFLKSDFHMPNQYVKTNYGASRNVLKYTYIFGVIEILERLMGGEKNLRRAINICKSRSPSVNIQTDRGWTDKQIGNILALMDVHNTELKISNDEYELKNVELNIHAKYRITPGDGESFMADLITIGSLQKQSEDKTQIANKHTTKIPLFGMFEIAYTNYKTLAKLTY